MTSFLKFLKKHIIAIIVIIILLAVGIVGSVLALQMLGVGKEGTLYGNRLDGIEKVGLKNESLDKITTEMKNKEYVKSATSRIEGRTINFNVDVANETSLENAKKVAEPILTTLTDEEKAFYDIQVFVTCKENAESEEYPFIGYKHRTSSDFSW